MLFTSVEFVVFLAAVLLLYYVVPHRWQWVLLLVASLFFYWSANPVYLIFVGVTILSTYIAALLIGKASAKPHKRRILVWCLIFNLGILAVTKYTGFVLGRWITVDMIVPLGISFYTFQTMSYIIDVYRGRQSAQRNVWKLALFVTFFPQMVQGPISRYGDLSKTLYEPHHFNRQAVAFGIFRIIWGYFKKLVIADRLIIGVSTLIGSEAYSGAYVVVTMLTYAFQLYCDFTGGIDITIGIAEAMGIRLAENFDLPYFSKNIREYWNRWHITMGAWFTDYIFYPISVSKPMRKLSKWSRTHLGKTVGKRVTVYLSSFAVWLTTGIWHGAAWNFIAWGLTNWVVITLSKELEPLYARFHEKTNLKEKVPYEIFQVIRTIALMSVIRLFDCYRDVPMTLRMVGSMATAKNWSILTDGSLLNIGLSGADWTVVAVGLFVVLGVSLFKAIRKVSLRQVLYPHSTVFYATAALLIISILIIGAYGIGYDSAQFIYNQF